MENKNRRIISRITFSGLMIALGFVLEQVKIFQMPQGGSVTLFGMLPIVLLGYLLGTRQGILGGICVGVLNIFFGGYIIHPAQLILDYILSFGVLGLSGLFKNKNNGLTIGYIIAILARYICFVLSGWIFFGDYAPENFSALTWSIWYNLTFVAVEAAMTIVVINLPPVKKLVSQLQNICHTN